MSEVTLKIPAKQIRPFREAAIQEAKYSGAWVARAADEQLRRGSGGGSLQLADIRSSCSYLTGVLDVLESLAEADGDTEVRAKPEVLAHITEAMANCIRPRLEAELGIIYNAELVARVQGLTESIGWAGAEATRLHAVSEAEIRAKKAPA